MCILLLISKLLSEAYLIKKIAEFWARAYTGVRKFIKNFLCNYCTSMDIGNSVFPC